MEDPPLDPDDWTDEQWQAHLQGLDAEEGTGPDDGAPTHRRLRASPGATVMGAAMFGLEQAIYGERPKEEPAAEADVDDPGRDGSIFDPDDPTSARIALVVDPSPPDER